MAQMSPLRQRMIEDMKVRNLAPATQRSYVNAVVRFSRHFNSPPQRLALEAVRAYQVDLVDRGISWSGLNKVVCALRFFYGVTLGRTALPDHIPHAKEPRKLPVVLSSDEVVRFLQSVAGVQHRVALTTAYAAGLRVSEVARLKIADIDSRRVVIRVEEGKGGKSLPRRRPGIATSCCRCSCWPSCGNITGLAAPAIGCFLVAPTTGRWPPRGCTRPAAPPVSRLLWASE
jgi:integrase/recombinase XerD